MNGLEKLETLKKDELTQLARKLMVKNYYRYKKEELKQHILDNYSEEQITAALIPESQVPKAPRPKRWKEILYIAGAVVTITAFVFMFIFQHSSEKGDKARDRKIEDVKTLIINKYGPPASSKTEEYEKKIRELQEALKDERAGSKKEREEALQALNNGDLSKAQALFEKLIEKDKKREIQQARTRYNLGDVYYLQLKYNKALAMYLDAEQLDPGNTGYQNSIGLVYLELAKYTNAREYFEKTLVRDTATHGEDHPSVARDWSNLGEAWRELGDYKKAISFYEKALKICEKTLGPNHPHTKTVKENLESIRE
jgi:tetratricopeptide (TPR) repeat protein